MAGGRGSRRSEGICRITGHARACSILVEDAPAANLVPWEEPAVQFSVSYAAGHDEPARIILYRLPIQSATRNRIELEYIVHDEIVRQLAGLSGKSPEDIDPDPLF